MDEDDVTDRDLEVMDYRLDFGRLVVANFMFLHCIIVRNVCIHLCRMFTGKHLL